MMAVSYKKLFKIMIDRNMKRRDLQSLTGISYATITKLYNGDNVTMEVIEKICKGMELHADDILEFDSNQEISKKESFEPLPIYSKREENVFRLGELFCGPGGLACGALRAKSSDGVLSVKHAWANDYDMDTCQTYRKNICPENPASVYCRDVRELDIKALGDIDAFCYGFPCNSFSNVGEHKGLANEHFGQLYWYGIEVLNEYKPKWFMAENVSGIRSAGSGDFQIILDDMKKAGYRLNVNLYKAEQYGIPQTRHRVIIVGIREDLPVEFRVPDPAQYASCDISSRTALADIPEDAPNREGRSLSEKVVKRLSYILPGENVWQAEERLGKEFPEELKIKTKTKISQIYRKLDPNKPAYTVTAAGGGGTYMYHWTDRELTNRERARIQTFPDNYEFIGNYSSVRKQIGMAVPCKLSEIVVTAILNSFAGIEYPWVQPNINE
ncbi:MAG: DNA (cytosine-5-)-methyltransferase [Lacrimispora saccharolytica]